MRHRPPISDLPSANASRYLRPFGLRFRFGYGPSPSALADSGSAFCLVTRHNPLSRVRPAFFCLQNRLNELGQNLAIEIREW